MRARRRRRWQAPHRSRRSLRSRSSASSDSSLGSARCRACGPAPRAAPAACASARRSARLQVEAREQRVADRGSLRHSPRGPPQADSPTRRDCARRARSISMNARRGSTCSPISVEKISSDATGILDLHLAAAGAPSGSIVVSQSCAGIHLAQALVALDGDVRSRASASSQSSASLNDFTGLLLVAALDRPRPAGSDPCEHVGRRADLRAVAAGEEIASMRGHVRRAVMRAHDDQAPRLGCRRRSAPRPAPPDRRSHPAAPCAARSPPLSVSRARRARRRASRSSVGRIDDPRDALDSRPRRAGIRARRSRSVFGRERRPARARARAPRPSARP